MVFIPALVATVIVIFSAIVANTTIGGLSPAELKKATQVEYVPYISEVFGEVIYAEPEVVQKKLPTPVVELQVNDVQISRFDQLIKEQVVPKNTAYKNVLARITAERTADLTRDYNDFCEAHGVTGMFSEVENYSDTEIYDSTTVQYSEVCRIQDAFLSRRIDATEWYDQIKSSLGGAHFKEIILEPEGIIISL